MTSKLPNEADIYAGKQVRHARRLVKMTQDDLAKAIGITFQQVQKYERGVNRMSVGMLAQMAAALKRDVAWFFEAKEASTIGEIDQEREVELAMSDMRKAIIRRLDHMWFDQIEAMDRITAAILGEE